MLWRAFPFGHRTSAMLRRRALLILAFALGATGPAALAQQPQGASVSLSALYAPENRQIRSGLVWRILQEDPGGGAPQVLMRSDQPSPTFNLPQGQYVIHAAYGYASGWRRVTVPASGQMSERVTLNAGALRLFGNIGDRPIPPALITFAVYVPLAGNSEGRLVADNVRSGDLLRLPEAPTTSSPPMATPTRSGAATSGWRAAAWSRPRSSTARRRRR